MTSDSLMRKILSFVFAAVAVAMVLESSTSVPGSKCLWNNVVSTLVWRVLNQPRGISPDGRGMSRGRGGERIHDRPDVVGHGEPSAPKRLSEALAQGIAARDEDLVAADSRRGFVACGGRTRQ